MNLKGKDLDDFFRKELSNGDIPFDKANWLKLEKRLKKNKRRNTIAWITLSGIAAMLLLTLSVSKIFFSNEKVQPIAKDIKKPFQNTSPDSLVRSSKADEPAKGSLEETREMAKNLPALAVTSSGFRTKNADEKKSPEPLKISPAEVLVTQPAYKETGAAQSVAAAPAGASQSPDQGNKRDEVLATTDPKPVIQKRDSILASANNPARTASSFSVSMMAGPDINGVNTLKSNRGGISIGLMLNYKLTKTLSISTGALYAMKLYNTKFEYYKPNSSYVFPNVPKAVNADCRVLDIPLNINYTAVSKAKDAVALSAGISSYLMLKEGYSFTYETPTTRGPKTYKFNNRNKHYLGILNFGAAYERKISDEVSVGVQPYVKIPVTDIGYGRVKLLSTGILTSVKLNILSKNK